MSTPTILTCLTSDRVVKYCCIFKPNGLEIAIEAAEIRILGPKSGDLDLVINRLNNHVGLY